MLPSWVMVIKLSKKVHFCNFVLTLARNPCLLKQFTYMHLKVLTTHYQKMVSFIMLWLIVSEILAFKVDVFCLISAESAFFKNILIVNISWRVVKTPIYQIIFWKSVMRTSRCIYVNCFNRLRSLREKSTELQKMHFFDNLRTTTQEGNMETRQMAPFFSSTLSTLTVCNIYFCIWK